MIPREEARLSADISRCRSAVINVLRRLAVAGLACLLAGPLAAEPAFPSDSSIVNVRDYGAKGDGKADDTQAIRAALEAARVDQGKAWWPSRMVYFPAGIYRVSDTIAKRDEQGRYLASMALFGESVDSVHIKLDDNAPGFGDPKQGKPVFYTSSMLLGGAPGAGGKDYLGKGEGNDAYGNYIDGMTIDVGRGNPGATAIDFLASNSGAIRHVRVVAAAGSGRIGISMDRKWPGPLLLMDVRVEGFAVGISVSQREYGVTFEDVSLSGQTDIALRNDGNSLAMRNIRIETAAVAIQNKAADGLIAIDRLAIALQAPTALWIDNRGYLTVKGVTVSASGERAKPLDRNMVTPGSTADGAYFGALRLADFDAGWRLPARSAPAPWAPAAARWANVGKYGAKPDSDEDAAPGIQAAMSSGAEAIYFPTGRYKLGKQIDVPAKVRRIAGMFAVMSGLGNRPETIGADSGMFRVEEAGEPLTIERLAFDNPNGSSRLAVDHDGPRTVVLRDIITSGVMTVKRGPAGGPLFLENTCCGPIRIAASKQGVWSRQFNTEGKGVRITNEGAPLSILGLKVEQNATVVENQAGAETDVIGGLLYLVRPPDTQRPAFTNAAGARLSATYAESAYLDAAVYNQHIAYVSKGQPAAVSAEALPSRGRARIVPGVSVGP